MGLCLYSKRSWWSRLKALSRLEQSTWVETDLAHPYSRRFVMGVVGEKEPDW